MAINTLHIEFVGVVCFYDPARAGNALTIRKRAILINASAHPHHPHEAFLEVPEGAINSDDGWPNRSQPYQRGNDRYERYTLDAVRLEFDTKSSAFDVDSTFDDFVPPLGQIAQNFGPILPEFIVFDPTRPKAVAAHVDITVGNLAVASFDPHPTRFDDKYLWPPPNGQRKYPFPRAVRLDIDIDDANPITILGEFYKERVNGTTVRRALSINPAVDTITVGNLMTADIEGNQAPTNYREHFKLYYALSGTASTMPIPEDETKDDRGFSGGCPNTQYPP